MSAKRPTSFYSRELPGVVSLRDRLDASKKARNRQNEMLVARIKGVAAQPSTPETDADPRNPAGGQEQ